VITNFHVLEHKLQPKKKKNSGSENSLQGNYTISGDYDTLMERDNLFHLNPLCGIHMILWLVVQGKF